MPTDSLTAQIRLLELARVTVSRLHTHFNPERHQRQHTPSSQWHEGRMMEDCPNPDCVLMRTGLKESITKITQND